ncbi:MAG: murein biosynthesis integral membrane protein MurJ [Clostridiales bacterium]|nr:murein biosynthesis integral membrane protein MurJ [Clostridiales bacterium]
MSASTALSRVTGFIRTWAIAYALGVTALAASYSVANNIPNMLYELVAGGVISSLFIPVFLERMTKAGREDAWRFASSLFNLTVLALAAVSILGTMFAAEVVRTQTFRVAPEEAALATAFFRFFAIQVLAYGAGAVIQGLLNAQRLFLWPALGPVFNNVVVIVTLLGVYVPLYPRDPDLAFVALAIGTTLGVFVQFGVQLPSLIKAGVRYTATIDFSHPGMRAIGKMALPAIVYVITNVVAVSFRHAFAFEVSPAGPATLMYAWMFYQLPYGIFAVALATAIFTELSESAGREEWERFRERFRAGMRTTALIIIPMAAMLIALSGPLITLYRAGRFTSADIPVVAEVLVWWAAGLFFFAGFMFVLKTFYSLKDTRTPAITNLVLTGVQIGLYAVLAGGVTGWAGLGLIGIPIADGIFFAISLAVLLFILRSRVGGLEMRSTVWHIARVTIAAILGAACAYLLASAIGNPDSRPIVAALAVISAGVAGLGVTYTLAWLMRVHEVATGVRLVRKLVTRGS